MGFTPYAGTLNIQLTQESKEKRKFLDPTRGFMVVPETGFCPGVLFKASIEGLQCAVVVPLVPDYPTDVLEVIAPVHLRGQLGLKDGSLVSVAVSV